MKVSHIRGGVLILSSTQNYFENGSPSLWGSVYSSIRVVVIRYSPSAKVAGLGVSNGYSNEHLSDQWSEQSCHGSSAPKGNIN